MTTAIGNNERDKLRRQVPFEEEEEEESRRVLNSENSVNLRFSPRPRTCLPCPRPPAARLKAAATDAAAASISSMTDINADRDSRSPDESVRSSLKAEFTQQGNLCINTFSELILNLLWMLK